MTSPSKDKKELLREVEQLRTELEALRARPAEEVSFECISGIQSTLNLGYWDWDLPSGRMHINQHLADLLEADLSNIQPSYDLWVERLHPDDRAEVLESINQYFTGGEDRVWEHDYRVFISDDNYVWVTARGRVVERDNQGRPVRMIGVILETTQQKELEEALRHNERNFQRAQQIAHLGTWEWNYETGLVHWSDEMFRIFGFSQPTPDGILPIREVFRRVDPRDKDVFRELLRDRPREMSIEFRAVRPDGDIRNLVAKGETARHVDGTIKGMLGIMQDITERKRELTLRDVLLKISQAANTIHHLLALLEETHKQLGRLINVSNFYVALYHPDTRNYSFPFHHDLEEKLEVGERYALEDSLTDYVRSTGESLWSDEKTHQRMMKEGLVKHVGVSSPIWIGVPLKTPDEVIGIVAVQSYDNPNAYKPEDLKLLEFVSDHIAMAIAHNRADEALSESQAILDFSYEATGDSLWDWEIQSGRMRFNRTWWTMFGYEPEEVEPTFDLWMEMIHPYDIERVDQLMQEYLVGNLKQFVVEYRARTRQGRWRWILTRGRILERSENGAPKRMIGTNVNIDRIKRTEEALRESESQFRKLIEYSPLPIMVSSLDGVIEILNSRFTQLYQYDQQDIPTIDDWWRLAFPAPQYRQQVARLWREKVEASGQSRDIQELKDIQIVTRKTATRDTEIRFSRIGDKELVIFLDTTERKRQEQERQHLDKRIQENQRLESIGLLAGGIAHDFNNLLAEIIGNTDLVQMKCSEMPAIKNNLEKIHKSAGRMALLTRQMLAYSGQGQFIIEPIDLADLINEMTPLLESSISEHAVLNLELDTGAPPISADSPQVRQLITNLVLNASDALEDKPGVITITTAEQECDTQTFFDSILPETPQAGAYIRLSIADTGVGIAEDALARIFDPFYTTKFTGRGLGLAAVLGIIRAHNGAIKVQSKPGLGTTFTVYLPVLQ